MIQELFYTSDGEIFVDSGGVGGAGTVSPNLNILNVSDLSTVTSTPTIANNMYGVAWSH